jgi:hypothetical protein
VGPADQRQAAWQVLGRLASDPLVGARSLLVVDDLLLVTMSNDDRVDFLSVSAPLA